LANSQQTKTFVNQNGRHKGFFDQDVFHDCLLYPARNRYFMADDVHRKNDLMEVCRDLNVTSVMISNLYMSSYLPPTVHDSTLCVHPLANAPFSPLTIKLATAKFLGFGPDPIEDDGGEGRFVKTLSGDLVWSERWSDGFLSKEFHANEGAQRRFQKALAVLIAVAQHTHRTLVLPRHVRDRHAWAYPTFSLVGVASLQAMLDVPWRFLTIEEARSLENRTEIVDVSSDFEGTLRATGECTEQVCALHGLYKTSNEEVFNANVIDEIIANLTWCFHLKDGEEETLHFVKSVGSWARPCS
jgi:hypothetical protein